MSTKKVPCTPGPAGAPWTSFVAAVDEVARTPPGRIFPDIWCSDTRIRPNRIREIPDQRATLLVTRSLMHVRCHLAFEYMRSTCTQQCMQA